MVKFLHTLFNTWALLPGFIRVTFVVAIVSLSGAMLSILFLYLSKLARQTKKAIKTRFGKEVRQMLLEEIVIPASEEKDVVYDKYKFEHFLQTRKYAHSILVNELIDFKNVFSGNVLVYLRRLYIDLGLHIRAMDRLKSDNWKTVSLGLVELYRIDIDLDKETLMKLAEHENRYIREIARWYIIKQSDDDPLYILESIHEPILPWEELEILRLFTEKKGFVMPPLNHLLHTNQEPTVIMLVVKLAAFFQQQNTIPEIIQLLKHPNALVRKEAIKTLGTLQASDAEKLLVDMYPAQPEFIKAEIIESLGRIASGRHVGFLQHELLATDSFIIKRSASHALVQQLQYSGDIIDNLLQTSAEQVKKLLKYYLNPITSRHA